jgi:hypothetical protein
MTPGFRPQADFSRRATRYSRARTCPARVAPRTTPRRPFALPRRPRPRRNLSGETFRHRMPLRPHPNELRTFASSSCSCQWLSIRGQCRLVTAAMVGAALAAVTVVVGEGLARPSPAAAKLTSSQGPAKHVSVSGWSTNRCSRSKFGRL